MATAHVRVLLHGHSRQSSCLELSCNGNIYLFNCPENIQRVGLEWKLKMNKLCGIFFTYVDIASFFGYPDLLMFASDLGESEGAPAALSIRGPSPLSKSLMFTVLTIYRPNYFNLDVEQFSPHFFQEFDLHTIKQQLAEPHICHNLDCFPEIPLAGGFSIRPILVKNPKTKDENRELYTKYSFTHAVDLKRFLYPSTIDTRNKDVMCYAVHSPETPGSLDTNKANKLGIPKGPLLGKLVKGESVTLPNGNVIHPQDCVSPPQCGPITLIIDCPNLDYLQNLIDNSCLNFYLTSHNSGSLTVNSIVHLAPLHILLDEKYFSFFSQFASNSNAKLHHLFVYSSDTHASPHLLTSGKLQNELFKKLDYVCPRLAELSESNFQGIQKLKKDSEKELTARYKTNNKTEITTGEFLSLFTILPLKKLGFDNSSLLSKNKEFDKIKWKGEHQAPQVPTVTFLGTAAAVASKYRGVSSILLEANESTMLIDCGSGTFAQMVRLFGLEGSRQKLRNLKCIWISHKHADHCQGIFQLLNELEVIHQEHLIHQPVTVDENLQCKACGSAFTHQTSNNLHQPIHDIHFQGPWKSPLRTDAASDVHCPTSSYPILIVGPMWIENMLSDYTRFITNLDYHFIDAQDLTSNNHPLQEYFHTNYGFSSVMSIRMEHSYPSYGIVIDSPALLSENGGKPWRLSYSADTLPFDHFIESAKNSTLLINECTFDDEVADRAKETSHCTLYDALTIAKRMNASFVVLTHFSTRYERATFPDVFSDTYFVQHPELRELKNRIAIAFDFTQLPICSDLLTSVCGTQMPHLMSTNGVTE